MSKWARRDFLEGIVALSAGALTTPHAPPDEPAYLRLNRIGELEKRAATLRTMYRNCALCPRDCRIDRTKGQLGKCRASDKVRISNAFPHFGEEPPLVGSRGSGTIFFSNCGLRCLYCQNYSISLQGEGEDVSDDHLARLMVAVQKLGCHNINLVTPTHYAPSIVNAVRLAVPLGLHVPLVYNTGGYEKPEIIRLLDGIVDIYMPDFKYWDPDKAGLYSSEAYNYPHYAREAHLEMYRQVGVLETDSRGIARRGMVIRILVLPNRAAGTKEVLKFIAEELSTDSYVNVMRQYRPEHKAKDYEEIARPLTSQEYGEALGWAKEFGLTRLAR